MSTLKNYINDDQVVLKNFIINFLKEILNDIKKFVR